MIQGSDVSISTNLERTLFQEIKIKKRIISNPHYIGLANGSISVRRVLYYTKLRLAILPLIMLSCCGNNKFTILIRPWILDNFTKRSIDNSKNKLVNEIAREAMYKRNSGLVVNHLSNDITFRSVINQKSVRKFCYCVYTRP
jgi:hypothetical protein